MSPTLKKKMAIGVIWMLFAKFADRALGLVSMLILARLLTPNDFGLIAMAMSIIALLEMLGAFSFDIALIQNQKAERNHYDTAWTFKVILSIIIAILLVFAAKPAAVFYDEPKLELIINLLTIGIFCRGFENIGVVAFRKDLDFRKEFWFTVTKKMISFSVTVPLAFWLRNYWALIAGMLTGWIGGTILSYAMHPFRPRFSLSAGHELFNFSKWLFINNIFFYLKNRSSDFVIGKISGSESLGVYNIGYEIANLPTTELISPINRAVYPGYAKISHDAAQLRQGFLDVISYIALLALPAGFGVSAVSELLVPVALGSKWLDAIPIVQIFGIFGAIVAMQTNIQSIYLSLGKPRIHTYITGAYLLLLFPSLIFATTNYGIIGAAFTNLGIAVLFVNINYFILFRVISLRLSAFLAVVWRPIGATLIMYGGVRLFVEIFFTQESIVFSFWGLGLTVLLGLILYVSTELLFWRLSSCPPGPEMFALNYIKKYLSNVVGKVKNSKS